jgi:uncharacterized peroxidase-related enzyme
MSDPEAARTRARENTIDLVTESEASGRVAELYEEIKATRDGDLADDLSLSKLWLLLGNDPALLEAFWMHTDHMYNGGSLPFELKSKISLVVASVMECEGCKFFHESALEHLGTEAADIADLKRLEIEDTGFSPTEKVVLQFAQKAADAPHDVGDEDLAALRDLGLSERELLELTDCIAFHVYTAVLQATAGIVYPGMDRDEWTLIPT